MGSLAKVPRGCLILSRAQLPKPDALARGYICSEGSEVGVPPADPQAKLQGQAVSWGGNLKEALGGGGDREEKADMWSSPQRSSEFSPLPSG